MSLSLSERDLRVLAKCAVCRWLTAGQLQRLYFPDVTQDAARKSLRRLSTAEHLFSFRENPMAEALYGVGSEGKSLLATKGLEVQSCRTPPWQVEHLIGVNDIRISIEADPNRLAYFFASWELPQFQWGHA
jgi:protein involved in plasmid replication-relaxation